MVSKWNKMKTITKNDSRQMAEVPTVAVIGLGFVGSSVAAAWLRSGAQVWGYDASKKRVDSLEGLSFDSEENIINAFKDGLKSANLSLASKVSEELREADTKIICVPVYLGSDHKADLSYLKAAATTVATNLKKGDAVIICPSVPPGTTRKVVKPILEGSSKLEAGVDFDLIYSPERIYVGRALQDIEERYPAIISGINDASITRAEELFTKIAKKGVLKMPSIEAAEFEKLAEGVFRDVNIALANELALICDDQGIDFWSVREAANTQPFCNIHTPSLGVGGACIPVYPWFVVESAKRNEAILTREGRRINDSMVDWLVDFLKKNYNLNHDTRIAILGLAFRGDIADSRLSVTYRLFQKLKDEKVRKIIVHDPIIDYDPVIGGSLISEIGVALSDCDIAIIATDHSYYRRLNWMALSNSENSLKIIDCRGVLRDVSIPGVEIYGLGYGKKKN